MLGTRYTFIYLAVKGLNKFNICDHLLHEEVEFGILKIGTSGENDKS